MSSDELAQVSRSAFVIGDWTVDPDAGDVIRDGYSAKLEPKAMALLVYMAKRSGEVLTRAELDEQVWPGAIVTDDSLTNAITKIRKVFSDDFHNPQFIRTIPKKGYQFIAKINSVPYEELPDSTGFQIPAQSESEKVIGPISQNSLSSSKKINLWLNSKAIISAVLGLAASILLFYILQGNPESESSNAHTLDLSNSASIVVIPLKNISNDPAQNYFSDGFSEDIITSLSQTPDLFVIARNSAFQYKDTNIDIKAIGRKLGVRFILQGSVQKQSNQIRINVQMADSLTRQNIWANKYNGSINDLFVLQDRVASDAITAIREQLGSSQQATVVEMESTIPAAYDEFLKGWELIWLYTRDGHAKAEQHFKNAIEIDPDYSRAHAALALIYWQAWKLKWHENSANPYATWTRAGAALKKAMLRPTSLAFSTKSAMYLYNRRYKEALVLAKQAIGINANSAIGYLALANAQVFDGQSESSIKSAEKGMRLDPNYPGTYLAVKGQALFDQKKIDEAAKVLSNLVLENPQDRNSTIILIASYGHLGNLEEGASTLAALNAEQEKQELQSFTLDWLKNRWPYREAEKRLFLIDGLKKANVPEW